MPCCARASTSLMSLLFLAVRSSSSFVLFMRGAVWLRTYFLVEHPALKTTTPASTTVMARLIVKFICFGSFKLGQLRGTTPRIQKQHSLGGPGCGPGKSFRGGHTRRNRHLGQMQALCHSGILESFIGPCASIS